MTIKISKHIAGYEVVKPEEELAAKKAAAEEREARTSAKVIRMTEKSHAAGRYGVTGRFNLQDQDATR